ncbi:sigma factor-like helix-turn-helix DNA-binding protein [Arthrobacter sp. zg-Y895]|uniref:sigma factor-like helix-turn-helix DNA-binding protein n=1 Tax=Arthrobacter sp. zg-Y895 TaxID=2886933 RepID=UPI001D15A8FF|nr:sigma factor-like helix-turn-helix DNA-binding protein [Arthrobacter sp. zg-Y895]MCC3302152.1 hypothetical protein [Arthrobacter sp. zg-Y895]
MTQTSQTSSPSPSRPTAQKRDAAMVQRYIEGETLEAIGADYGVTRERVRQIVSKVGGSMAAESRKRRLDKREAEINAAAQAFMASYGAVARTAAASGSTRTETILRLAILFPEMDKDLAESTLRDSSIRFDSRAQDIFSKAVVEAGLYYLVGAELGLAPDPHFAAANLDLDMMTELVAVLQQGTAAEEDIATILGIIGAAKRHIAKHPETTLTGSRYDELRDELVPALGWESRQGASPWPPTRQTVMGKYTYWNAALESIGLAANQRGRTPGLVKFTEKLYQKAIRDFVTDMQSRNLHPSHGRYAEWCADMNAANHEYPSPAALRNFFGSWTAALRYIQEHPAAPAESAVAEDKDNGATRDPVASGKKETTVEAGVATCPICSHEAWPIVRGLWCPPSDGSKPKVWPAGCVITDGPQPQWRCMDSSCGWDW